jgi:hypothetical protein
VGAYRQHYYKILGSDIFYIFNKSYWGQLLLFDIVSGDHQIPIMKSKQRGEHQLYRPFIQIPAEVLFLNHFGFYMLYSCITHDELLSHRMVSQDECLLQDL